MQLFYEVGDEQPSEPISQLEMAAMVLDGRITRAAPRIIGRGLDSWQSLAELEGAPLDELPPTIASIINYILPIADTRTVATTEAETAAAAAAKDAEQAKADAKNQEAATMMAVDAVSRLAETEGETSAGRAADAAEVLAVGEAAALAAKAAHARLLEESRLAQERLRQEHEEVREVLRLEKLARETLERGATLSRLLSRVGSCRFDSHFGLMFGGNGGRADFASGAIDIWDVRKRAACV